MAVLTRPVLAARRSPARAVAGLGTVLAGGLHAAAAVEHATAGWWVPVFFTATALAQLVGGVLVLAAQPAARGAALLVAGTVGLVCLFLVVHGTPWLGDLAGHAHDEAVGGGHAVHVEGAVGLGTAVALPEAAGALGLVTVAVQGVVVAAGTALLPARARRRTGDGLLVLGAVVVLLWMTGVLS